MNIRKATFCALLAVLALPCALTAGELENPVEGAVRRVYGIEIKHGEGRTAHERYLESFANAAQRIMRGGETPYSVGVDSDSHFRTISPSGWVSEIAMWSGFLKRKNGGPYTIIINSEGGNKWPVYSLWVNGRLVVSAGTGTIPVEVVLNPGFNEICLVMNSIRRYGLELTIKRADSIKEPTSIGPADLWHEDELDDEDDD